jgi:ADP-heptose:LPS heptosyltransferase
MLSFRFQHGLGDCANAAHLFHLYIKKGYEIAVACAPDKAPIFHAAGCAVIQHAPWRHGWDHPPAPSPPGHNDSWSGNKTAFNISRAPLPDIGNCAECWQDLVGIKLDLDQQLTPQIETEVELYVRQLTRPLILFAPQGNTGTENKNLSHDVQAEVLRGLLDLTDGCVIVLDWDQRVYKLNNWRIRHLGDDWRGLSVLELYCLIKRADLVLSVDSGVLHFTRFTSTPAIGMWTGHYPSHFALPRQQTLHLVPKTRNELTRYRRIAYNVVECPGERVSGRFIAEQAANMLGPRKYLTSPAPDCVLRQLVAYCRQFDSPLTSFIDRHKTFDAFLAEAKRKHRPLIAETGCIRAVEDFSAGYSTYLVGFFLHNHGGKLISIDYDSTHVAFCKAWTGCYGQTVEIFQEHSHQWLKNYSGPAIDLLYLDSADVGTTGYQECARMEAELALPHLASDGVIMFDDTCWKAGAFRGKGATAVPWLLQRGWKIRTAGYQVLLARDFG